MGGRRRRRRGREEGGEGISHDCCYIRALARQMSHFSDVSFRKSSLDYILLLWNVCGDIK